MIKKLAILALLVTMWCVQVPVTAKADISSTTPPQNSTIHKKTTVRHSKRRAKHVRDPWGLSSNGDPTADDNAMGEDPIIRQAAVEAIGRWNGSVVVVDPNTGRILSMVNQKLALSSGFTPCSTIKPLVALAALREGIITPSTKLYIGDGQRMNVSEALARSNNPFFHKLGEMLGFQRITQYAREFGFGERAGLEIPGESPGRYPDAPPREGGVGFLAYCGTSIEVTALQMAALVAAIANGGTLYALQYPRTPEEIAGFQPVVRRTLDNLTDYIPQIRDGMAGSVLYGTGRSAYNSDLPIFGKTGTCSENGARLGWFVSYADNPPSHYVVVVLLRGGRMMFGPHAAEIAGQFYRGLMQHEHSVRASSGEPALLPRP